MLANASSFDSQGNWTGFRYNTYAPPSGIVKYEAGATNFRLIFDLINRGVPVFYGGYNPTTDNTHYVVLCGFENVACDALGGIIYRQLSINNFLAVDPAESSDPPPVKNLGELNRYYKWEPSYPMEIRYFVKGS